MSLQVIFGLCSTYHRMKALTTVDHRKTQFLKYWLQFTSAVFLLEIVRSLVVWYSIKYQDPRWFRVDLFAAYAAQRRFKDPYIAICCGFLFLFGFGNNQLFHRCISHPTICDIFNELLVVNTHDFLQSNQPGVHLVLGSLKDSYKSPWKTILQLGRIYRHLWRFGSFPSTGRQNKAKAKVKFNEKMSHFKFLSVDDRIRIFLVNAAFEVPCKLISLALVLANFAFTVGYFFFLLQTSAPLVSLFIALLDSLLIFYLFWMLVQNGLIIGIMVVLFYLLFHSNYSRVNLKMRVFLQTFACHSPARRRQLEAEMRQYFGRLRVEHGELTRFLLQTNTLFWSALFFVFVACNLPNNVYFVAFLYLKANSFIEVLIMSFVLALQSSAIFSFLFPGNISRLAHLCSPYLVPMQALIRGGGHGGDGSLPLKIKYLSFYEQTNSYRKIGYTVGSIECITRSNICRFAYSYAGYFLFVAPFAIKK